MRTAYRPGAVIALGMLLAAGMLGPAGAASASSAASDGAHAAVTDSQCTAATRIDKTPPALAQLQSDLVHRITDGAGVLVAVVDSGVNAANPHLTAAMAGGVDLVGDGAGADGYADVFGHGTAIAGIIAARAVEGSGVVGLAPGARILSVRVFAGTDDNDVTAGYGPSVDKLAAGIRYAADQHAQVINVSLSTASDDARLSAAVAYATEHGSLVLASAGNRDSSLALETDEKNGSRYPAGSPDALGVAAADADGVVTEASIHGPQVAVSAPGQNILTTSAAGGDCIYAADTPATSFATGYAAAAAALVVAAHPTETPAQWAFRLEASAVRIVADRRDDVSGWGFIQPYDAIILVPGAGLPGPTNPFPGTDVAPTAAPTSTPIAIEHVGRADIDALRIGAIVAVVAFGSLGVLGALAVMLSRRRGAAEWRRPRRGAGLFGSPTPKDDD